MNRPADGFYFALRDIVICDGSPVEAARAAAAWMADHLDALAEIGAVDRGSFRLAAAEVRAAGGVS